jgi:uncharacterized membrane protein
MQIARRFVQSGAFQQQIPDWRTLPMSNLLVVMFENQEDGRSAHAQLKNLSSEGGVHIQDVELVERDADGKINKVSGKVDDTTKAGILGGGFLGLLMGFVFFPVLGIAIGAVAGGLIGKSFGNNIDKKLVQDVVADLTPGTSALFMLVDGPGSALLGLFRPYKFKVYETSLDPELEQQLREEGKRAS